ncbi:serine-rich adhesin for platelets isoform X2 [Drosophila innubila]|uniref:serine-rich adhesin for platelets isoform X2 n=1 Tax=Drosophila innubila TaxID=198719 RepID=UPI00148CD16F|nr:serine-rich adhesin for platelets isoform X2 [Drosophila innubila]
MDSRMLNVFHEDPFEGNFVKYDPEPNFWSANDELQLTDTLNGILPIPPTDESLLSQKEAEEQLQNSKNLLIYSDFVDQHLSDDANVLNGQVYRAITDSEVEAAYEQQRHLSALIDSDDEDANEDHALRAVEDDDLQSQSTFRTRTDSSSIGDYESHSSDYDDDDDDDDEIVQMPDERLLSTDAFVFQDERKCRTLSTNTVNSDADALGLNIDVNNFDLADFITKDDFADNLNTLHKSAKKAVSVTNEAPLILPPAQVSVPVPITVPTKAPIAPTKSKSIEKPIAALPKPVIISSKSRDSDYDSDSIIDVETVDVIDVDESLWTAKQADETETVVAAEDLCYVDNVKEDPSWSPKQNKHNQLATKTTTTTTATTAATTTTTTEAATAASTVKPKSSNNICLVPNKKQCDFLKRKVGVKSSGGLTANKSKVSAKKIQEANNKNTAAGKQTTTATTTTTLAKLTETATTTTTQPFMGTGLGLGGKNLALLKHERERAIATATPTLPTPTVSTPAPKRKLNLEEYKQRKSGAVGVTKQTPVPVKQLKLDGSKSQQPPREQQQLLLPPQKSPQKAAISSIVNSLKCATSQGTGAAGGAVPATDPITVAKNKVLRMLELKRAQQLKIIDSRVTAKVPKVTKLPPLKDIVKDTYCMERDMAEEEANSCTVNKVNKAQGDYEEIIIVSTSCNTDITIPPQQASVALRDHKTTPSSRSLLKSSVLLYNMSQSSKDMTNSLIASIQSEVVRQTNCVALVATTTATAAAAATASKQDKKEQHGEDMVIMHLAKNRVRKRMISMGTQTDLQPEFPLLTLPTTRQSRERRRRTYRKRNTTASSSSSSCSSASSIASFRSRSRSNSNCNSLERLRQLDVTGAGAATVGGGGSVGCGGGYSSRSTHRHRSSVSSSSYSEEGGKYERQQRQRQRRTSYNKKRSKNLAKRDNNNCSSTASEFSDRERSRSPLRRSRSRSQSPTATRNNNNNNSSSSNNNRRGFVDRNVSQPAVEERRIVYVGRIETDTTKELLRRKFLPYGSIKQITIHYKENGMKYGFVTFERAQDAFTAIDTSPRDAQINMYDISFGGRRAFCRASYADLDNAGINNYHSYVFPKAAPAAPPQEDSFEALLLKVKAKLNAGKPATTGEAATTTTTTTAEGGNNNNNNNNNPTNGQI